MTTKSHNPADKVEHWPIEKLVPYAKNSRTHSEEQVAQIAASIKEWGFTTAVLVDAACLMAQRGQQYDRPEGERSMGRAVAAFNAITGHALSESEGWLLLQVLKDVRQFQNPGQPHRDSLEDCVAYAALKAEAKMRETEHA